LNDRVRQFLTDYIEARHQYFSGIIETARFVSGPSAFVKKVYDQKYRLAPERFRVLPLGLEFHEASRDKGHLPWIQFGYIGAPERKKGLELTLQAFRNLEYSLHLWGHDPQDGTLDEESLSRPNIHCHGAYDPLNDLEQIFSTIHVSIVPSLSEIFGITARESLAHRVPVIASDWGGLPEAVSHQHNGLLFEIGDADSLRECVQFAATHPEAVRAMVSRTRETLTPMEDHVEQTLALYQNGP
jgi:glycosyltransferase involved in cell wall biosynthesis